MTALLLRLFVKDYDQTDSPAVRTAVGTLSSLVGIVCNLALVLFKLIAGSLSGSVSITADAMNNLSDASGSIVTFLGFRMADKPADEEHPYGHARAEYLSALAVAALILVIGVELGKTSVQKIFRPEPVLFSWVSVGVLAASIAVKLWMSLFNRRLGRHIGSTALAATAADSRNDCLATAAVLLAMVAEHLTDLRLDGFMGLGVAVFILLSGWELAKQTISPLLGERTAPEMRRQIVDYIAGQPKVLGYHDLMVHDYGPGQRFASIHVEMDHREDPLECHERIDDMERECLRSHNIHLVIHYDPVVVDDPALNELKRRTEALLKARDPRLCLHDFRLVQGKRHVNVLFDVPLPPDLHGQEDPIRQSIESALNQDAGVTYHVKITFDAIY